MRDADVLIQAGHEQLSRITQSHFDSFEGEEFVREDQMKETSSDEKTDSAA